MKKIFGTDGIRGIANQPPMTVDMITRIGRAATYALQARKVVIGKDTRLSGYLVEAALTAGFCSMGADVYLVGPMPTPGIAFLTHNMRADAGVVISASHNPYQDNGIKFFAGDGFKISDVMEQTITQHVFGNEIDHHLPTAEHIGKVFRIKESKGRYLVFAKNSFPRELSLTGLKIVVDCAHGAAYSVAPLIFAELGAEVITMHAEPNGTNINDKCGALHPEAMAKRVVAEQADLGIALDGDGDRAIFADAQGKILNGDTVVAIAAVHLKQQGKLKNHGVVTTVMSNYGLKLCLQQHGIALEQADVGDRQVVESMRRLGYNLGGEQSGHIVFLDHTTTGDGLITALQLLSVMVAEEKPLAKLAQIMQWMPQALVNVAVRHKKDLATLPKVQAAIRQVESELAGKGRILVRYSGTENLARVMVEGQESQAIEQYAAQVAESIRLAVGLHES